MYDKMDIKTNPNLVTVLGIYIRSKRTAKNIGLREMADKLNISPAYLSNLEHGKHNMTNPLLLRQIAKILEIDHLKLYKIIGYTDKDTSELKSEMWLELVEDISNMKIIEIIQKLVKMPEKKIDLIKHYIDLLDKE